MSSNLGSGERIHILGVNVDSISIAELKNRIDQLITNNKKSVIAHVNIKAMNLAWKQCWFQEFLNHSEIVICDGMGVQLGARILNLHPPLRYTHADWIWDLLDLANDNSYSLYFLGGLPGVADRARVKVEKKYSQLIIRGTHHGYFDKTNETPENRVIIEQINEQNPDILVVGFGMPEQERWILENNSELQTRVIIPCGAMLEYVSGDLKRGPRWMTQFYLEWLARIILSPKRYAKRYLIDIPLFFLHILGVKFGFLNNRKP